MSLPKLLTYCGIFLFGLIFILAFYKGGASESAPKASEVKIAKVVAKQPIEVPLDVKPADPIVPVAKVKVTPPPQPAPIKNEVILAIEPKDVSLTPDVNRIEELFKKNGSTLKFVDTIVYKSRVPWQKGRPAWLSDYASFYETSRHFIARSLNGKPDYMKQDLAENERFNVFRKDVKLSFHLVVDASLCKMWLYAIDETHQEKTLLKTYTVCLGRPDNSKTSGLLTPLGKYSLGSRVAIYKPKVMGYHNGKKIEMVRVFGSRWIPFDKEIANATAPAKGFGLHGVPWVDTAKGGLAQDKSSLGKYESDGCIRLSTEDMEEIFAIIITKPTEIEIVRHFADASIHKR